MGKKRYGRDRREKTSFGSKRNTERKPDSRNPSLKKGLESRQENKEGKSEYTGKGRGKSNNPYQKGDSGTRSPGKLDETRSERDSDRRRNRPDSVRPGSARKDSDSKNYAKGKRSEFSDKRRKYSEKPERGGLSKKTTDRFANSPDKETLQKKHYSKKKQLAFAKKEGPKDGILRLNKYIANTGSCSRREADKRIEEGRVSVNGKIVTEVGTKIHLKDVVCMDGKQLHPEAKVYLVLNKPKDFVTTLDDPMGRKTVMNLIKNACPERVYPIGRLDRMTTGVLLFTNDGDLTKRLTHPSYNKKKIYHVFLDRAIAQEELDQILNGIELEDGEIAADAISFTNSDDKTQVGIEIHSGRNRIVRRIFEHFGYEVEKLDRVFFAGITKKNIPRGKWRFLSEKEVQMLKIY